MSCFPSGQSRSILHQILQLRRRWVEPSDGAHSLAIDCWMWRCTILFVWLLHHPWTCTHTSTCTNTPPSSHPMLKCPFHLKCPPSHHRYSSIKWLLTRAPWVRVSYCCAIHELCWTSMPHIHFCTPCHWPQDGNYVTFEGTFWPHDSLVIYACVLRTIVQNLRYS